MKPRAIILFSADSRLQHSVLEAATGCRRALRLASQIKDALTTLRESLDDVDMIILDLDSEIRGVMLLNAVSFCSDRIPVVTVTSFERDYTLPISLSKGAVACLGKPVEAHEIATLIERHCGSAAAYCGREVVTDSR